MKLPRHFPCPFFQLNRRTTYPEWAALWGDKAEAERPRWRQGLMVRSWIARSSLCYTSISSVSVKAHYQPLEAG